MEDPVLGLHSRVDILHGGVKLLIRDASFHVPEGSRGHKRHQTLLEHKPELSATQPVCSPPTADPYWGMASNSGSVRNAISLTEVLSGFLGRSCSDG